MDSRELLIKKEPLLIVAPMQGVTDYPYRKVLENIGGMDAFLSEYIVVSDKDCYAKREIKDVFKSWNDPDAVIPLIPQVISSSIEGALKVVRDLKRKGIESIDVNMGCPTKSAIGRKCGAWQSEHPKEAKVLLDALRKEVPKGLSVKTRIGQTTTNSLIDLIDMLNESGCDFVTLHCRLATKGYHGEVFPDKVLEAALNLKVPMIYNGGISDPTQLDQIAQKSNSKGVMVGRGIMQNPWLFKQVREFRISGEIKYPTRNEFLGFFEHLDDAYAGQNCLESGRLKKMKQLITTFKHPGSDWDVFLQNCRRTKLIHDFFAFIKEIPDELLQTIGKPTNQYFEEWLVSS
ncbi:MAG: hypothetical protein COA79_08815 [Planctomycetota bacterium]|nr:MAG: hypothetical protein COA79_08815 [Planctomycetota bacterium]